MKKLITLFLVTIVLVSCGNTQVTEHEIKEVNTFTAKSITYTSDRNYSFISQPYRTSELSFRIGGPIVKLDVQNGQFFSKGEVIAEVDNRDYILNAEKAEAVYNRAEAEYNRMSNLFKKEHISEAIYEKAKADYEQAKANYSVAKNNLSDTKLVAPFDGYVQTIHAERYQDIKPSMPVITFIDLSKIKIEAFVPEDIAINFKKEDKSYDITFKSLQGKIFNPSEIFISQNTSSNNISYCLTAIINNKNNTLLGGMTGKLDIKSNDNKEKVIVPQTAICNDPNNGTYVWKITNNNVVKRCSVKTGNLEKDNMIEILDGVNKGEIIATSRLQYISDGEQISVNS